MQLKARMGDFIYDVLTKKMDDEKSKHESAKANIKERITPFKKRTEEELKKRNEMIRIQNR